MDKLTPEKIQEIQTFLDAIDFEMGEITGSLKIIADSKQGIKDILSGEPKGEEIF